MVAVYGIKSNLALVPKLVLFGMPQGSHLGLQFLFMFVNDIALTLFSKFNADDLKLNRAINSLGDAHLHQDNLNRVCRWSVDNCMVRNTNKFYHIKLTRRRRRPLFVTYFTDRVPLSEVSSIRDLDVVMDATLSFTNHLRHNQ